MTRKINPASFTRRQAVIGTAALALAGPKAFANTATPAVGLDGALAGARLKPAGLAARAARSQRLFGTSLNVWNMGDTQYMDVIARESSILVAENALKANEYRASPTKFDFSQAEIVYAFAQKNQMAFRGHTLVWHRSIPQWVLNTIATPAQAQEEFYLEVREPCLHFKGRVHSWDVANEVLRKEDGQPFGMKKTYWLEMLGPDYVDMAFFAAKTADPDALLCFNVADVEYDHPFFEGNRQVVLDFVKRLQANKVPIDVIGIQSHLLYAGIAKFPFSIAVFQRFLSQIADLGLRVIISELDVPDANLPADIPTRDADVAAATGNLVAAAVGHPAVIAIVCWGLTDRYAWMNSAPTFKRKDGLRSRGMLFDDNMQPKLAYHAAAQALDNAVPV